MTLRSVYLRGGLGNQFFQWLFALWLAQDGAPTVVDVSFIRRRSGNQARGQLELRHLFHDLRIPVQCKWQRIAPLEPALTRIARLSGRLSDDVSLDTGSFRQMPHHYGYYQQARFYLELDEGTRNWLEASACPSSAYPPRDLQSIGPYAALHIRAGDYRLTDYNRNQLGVLEGEYYEAALAQLLSRDPQRPVIVVSDDFASCRALMPRLADQTNVIYLDRLSPQAHDSHFALQVLLHAQALSCANSSFSAMAAYVGRASQVIAPTPWFRSDSLRHIAPQLSSWQLLNAAFETDA